MFPINRNLFIVFPKQPFLDWITSLPDQTGRPVTMDELTGDHTVYLMPIEWGPDEVKEHIEPYKPAVFAPVQPFQVHQDRGRSAGAHRGLLPEAALSR